MCSWLLYRLRLHGFKFTWAAHRPKVYKAILKPFSRYGRDFIAFGILVLCVVMIKTGNINALLILLSGHLRSLWSEVRIEKVFMRASATNSQTSSIWLYYIIEIIIISYFHLIIVKTGEQNKTAGAAVHLVNDGGRKRQNCKKWTKANWLKRNPLFMAVSKKGCRSMVPFSYNAFSLCIYKSIYSLTFEQTPCSISQTLIPWRHSSIQLCKHSTFNKVLGAFNLIRIHLQPILWCNFLLIWLWWQTAD